MGITAHGTVPVPAPTQEPQHDDGWKGSSGTDDVYTNSSPGALSTPQKDTFHELLLFLDSLECVYGSTG